MSHLAKFVRTIALAIMPLTLVSCGGNSGPKIPNQKKTVPVHGTVFLDGQPADGVTVFLNPKDAQTPPGSHGSVGEDGSFHIRTYGIDDGAPAGEYLLTFKYVDPKLRLQAGGADDIDNFKGKYANPKTSKRTLSVKEDAGDVDAGRIDLQK